MDGGVRLEGSGQAGHGQRQDELVADEGAAGHDRVDGIAATVAQPDVVRPHAQHDARAIGHPRRGKGSQRRARLTAGHHGVDLVEVGEKRVTRREPGCR